MLMKNIINSFVGALLSVIAANLLTVTFVLKSKIASFGWSSIKPADFVIPPLYVLIHIYWLVIPIGLVCGLVIPLLVRNETRRQALVYGIAAGMTVGLVFAFFSAYDFAEGTSVSPDDSVKWWGRFWSGFASSLPLAIGYCSIWTSAYALIKARGESGDESIQENPYSHH